MKKVWDFLLLLVSGLLVFVAIIAVALWLGYRLMRGSRPLPLDKLDLSATDVH